MSEPERPAPTEAGWYRWRPKPTADGSHHPWGPWECVWWEPAAHYPPGHRLYESHSRKLRAGEHGYCVLPEGEWGERIPDCDTLRARRELADQEPWITHGGLREGVRECPYCGRFDGDHAPDCPWLRAQEA